MCCLPTVSGCFLAISFVYSLYGSRAKEVSLFNSEASECSCTTVRKLMLRRFLFQDPLMAVEFCVWASIYPSLQLVEMGNCSVFAMWRSLPLKLPQKLPAFCKDGWPPVSLPLASSPFFGEGKALPGLLWFKMFCYLLVLLTMEFCQYFPPSFFFFFFLLGSFKAFPCPYRIPQWEQWRSEVWSCQIIK